MKMVLLMESEEYVEEEEEEEEPSLLDVISSYRHDADKIVILARSIETILHYTERLEENKGAILAEGAPRLPFWQVL